MNDNPNTLKEIISSGINKLSKCILKGRKDAVGLWLKLWANEAGRKWDDYRPKNLK
jgi:hypothetical protein